MEILKKLIAKKYAGLYGGMSRKESVAIDRGNDNKTLPENFQRIPCQQSFLSFDSDEMLKTAIEMDESNSNEKLITANCASKSTLTTNSISPYKRSVSPDTMLQDATSNTSISPRCSQRTISLVSDYSSDLSFFGMKSMIVTHTSGDTLVQYWWDLTPENIHTIVTNYLYDSDNRRCNQCWTFLEEKLGISRLIVFYILTGVYFLYILNGDLAKLLYYAMGVGYPMYKTYITYESRGLNACRSWLRLIESDKRIKLESLK